MAAFNLSPIGNGWQFFGAVGANIPPNLPLNGGFINTFAAGTNTPLATYANNLGSISNPTSLLLGPDGRPTVAIWFPAGVAFKFQLTDSTGFQIWIEDNLVGVNDTGSSVTSEWIASGATPIYSSATIFTTAGNTTSTFQVGRRVQATVTAGTVYGTIASSVFGVSTTVTLIMDAGMALDNGLVTANVGLLGGTHPSVPQLEPLTTPNWTIDVTTGLFRNTGLSQVAFYAYATTQTSGTTVIFPLLVGAQQGGTNYSVSTGLFTAPVAGWYLFTSGVSINNTSGSAGNIFIRWTINGSGTSRGIQEIPNSPSGLTACVTSSIVLHLVANDTVEVRCPPLAANFAIAGLFGNDTFFSGVLLF